MAKKMKAEAKVEEPKKKKVTKPAADTNPEPKKKTKATAKVEEPKKKSKKKEEPQPVEKKKGKKKPAEEIDLFDDTPKKSENKYKLKSRDHKGLTPLYAPDITKGCPVSIPKKITPESLLEWMEALVSHHQEAGHWITNTGLEEWRRWLTQGGYQRKHKEQLSEVAYKTCIEVLTAAIKSRKEPEEYSKKAQMERAAKEKGREPNSRKRVATNEKKVGNISVASGTGNKGAKRYDVWGMSITSVMRWMGNLGWDRHQVRKAMQALGFEVADSTIAAQISSGRKGDEGSLGKLATPTKEQASALKKLIQD